MAVTINYGTTTVTGKVYAVTDWDPTGGEFNVSDTSESVSITPYRSTCDVPYGTLNTTSSM